MKVSVVEVLRNGKVETRFDSESPAGFVLEFPELRGNIKIAGSWLDELQRVICQMHVTPEDFETEDCDVTKVEAAKLWLGELYAACYNHPDAKVFVK